MPTDDAPESPTRRQWNRYLDYDRDFPEPPNDGNPNRIDIVTDPVDRAAIEATNRDYLASQGHPAEWGDVGIMFENAYYMVIQDPVRFPDGRLGTFLRFVPKPLGVRAVVIVPTLDGKVVLLRHFRHGVRDWSLEFPRGGCNPGVDAEETARTELVEEIGATISRVRKIGQFNVNAGQNPCVSVLFHAELEAIGAANAAEGIDRAVLVDPAELEHLIGTDEILDSFTLSGFAKARVAGVI
jgi:ADP-ribose pyrophosphatase